MTTSPACPVCGLDDVPLMPSKRVAGHYQAIQTKHGVRRSQKRCDGRGDWPEYPDAPATSPLPTFQTATGVRR